MGFFKNIGKAIKKVTKKISFNNIIKVASSLDPTGISRGVIDSVEAKKAEKKALEEQKKAELEYQKQLEAQNAAEAEKQRQAMEQAKITAEQQRQIVAMNTQAIGGKVGILGGSIVGQIGSSAAQAGYEQINQNLKEGVANVGADMANMTLSAWFKKNWLIVVVGVLGVGIALRFLIGGQRR